MLFRGIIAVYVRIVQNKLIHYVGKMQFYVVYTVTTAL
jgi:hypothetical protein